MAKERTPESMNLDAVGTYLQMQGYFFFRVNNGGVYDVTKKIHRALPKFSIKGVSDFIVVHDGQVYFIEIKNEKTLTHPKTYQSPEQKAFEAMIEANGSNYHVVRSLDDIKVIFPRRARQVV